jgi:hypothetical protein
MASIVSPYSTPVPICSDIIKNPSESVPSTEDLEAAQLELRVLRQKSLEYVKKVGEDIKTLDESRRLIKEKEKQKGKRKEEKPKERGCGCYFFALSRIVLSEKSNRYCGLYLPLLPNRILLDALQYCLCAEYVFTSYTFGR